MKKELKIRILEPRPVIDKLLSLGARHLRDATYEYTYFNQPKGNVLKLTWKDDKAYKTVIEAEGDRFVIKSSDELSDPKVEAAQLATKYGIKRHLINHRSFYVYGDDKLSINSIEGVGTFLIIEGADPQLSFVTDTLGIKNPEVIKDSFDNL